MTQINKCTTCRQRKVKCDERQPSCSSCMKKNRPCRYDVGENFLFCDETSKFYSASANHPLEPSSGLEPSKRELFLATKTQAAGNSSKLRQKSSKLSDCGNGLFVTLVQAHSKGNPKSTSDLSTGLTDANRLLARPARLPTEDTIAKYFGHGTIPRISSTADAILKARWLSAIVRDHMIYERMQILSPWIPLMISQIGTSSLIDLSATYFISGITSYCTKSEQNIKAARVASGRVLSHLRSVLAEQSVDRRDVMLSIRVITDTEFFMDGYPLSYAPHVVGLSKLLISSGRASTTDEITRSVYYSLYFDEAMHAIVTSRSSVFDSQTWLETAPPLEILDNPALKPILQGTMQQMVQIPTLVLLVRSYRADPCNKDLQTRTLELVNTLHLRDVYIESKIQKFNKMSEDMRMVPHAWPISTPMFIPRHAYNFKSTQFFSVVIRFWLTRVLLCGLRETLYLISIRNAVNCATYTLKSSTIFQHRPVQSQDVEAAKNIAMCIPYAFGTLSKPTDTLKNRQIEGSLDHKLPLLALRLCLSIQMSFGSWHRLEKRAVISDSFMDDSFNDQCVDFVGQVQGVKIWLIEYMGYIQRQWGFVNSKYEGMERKVESYAGGQHEKWRA